jgi:hypothetical protein
MEATPMKITNTLTQYISAMLLATACVTTGNGFAADNDPVGLTPTPEDAAGIAKQPNYSPYAGRGFPTQVYWGDTHVHTDNSLDARGFGVTLGPEQAFRFARGEEVTTSNGERFKLSPAGLAGGVGPLGRHGRDEGNHRG